MKILKNVALNTIYQLLGRFSLSIFSFLTSIVITTNLGSSIWGKYSIAVNYIALFYLLTDLGISTYLAKDFAIIEDKREIKSIFSKLIVLKVIAAFILISIAFLIAYFSDYNYEIKNAIYAGLPLIFAFSIFNTTSLLFQSVTGYLRYFITLLTWTLLSYIGIWIYINVYAGTSIANLVFLNSFFAVFSAVMSLYFLRGYICINRKSYDVAYFRNILLKSSFVGLTLFVNTLMFSSDKIVLSFLSTATSVGIYSLAYKLFEIFLIVPTLLMNTLYPTLVRVKVKSASSYKNHILGIMILNFFSWVILATMAVVIAKHAIPYIWGDQFVSIWQPFSVLIMTSLPFYLTAPLSWLAILENKMKQMLAVYSIGFVINLALNIIYIPIYDYHASALITGLSEFVVLILLILILKR